MKSHAKNLLNGFLTVLAGLLLFAVVCVTV